MLDVLMNLLNDESGQDTLEYVFIGLVIALGAIVGMGKLAASMNAEFSKLAADLT